MNPPLRRADTQASAALTSHSHRGLSSSSSSNNNQPADASHGESSDRRRGTNHYQPFEDETRINIYLIFLNLRCRLLPQHPCHPEGAACKEEQRAAADQRHLHPGGLRWPAVSILTTGGSKHCGRRRVAPQPEAGPGQPGRHHLPGSHAHLGGVRRRRWGQR